MMLHLKTKAEEAVEATIAFHTLYPRFKTDKKHVKWLKVRQDDVRIFSEKLRDLRRKLPEAAKEHILDKEFFAPVYLGPEGQEGPWRTRILNLSGLYMQNSCLKKFVNAVESVGGLDNAMQLYRFNLKKPY